LIFLLFFLLTLLVPKITLAQNPLGIFTGLASFIGNVSLSAVLSLIWGITSPLPAAMGALLDIVLNLNLSYTHAPFIYLGWRTVRDFTNLFFVIALIIIGLATALRIKDYEAKKTLPWLIFIALLINFSLVITGMVIDASNILMNYFLSEVSNLGSYFGTQSQLLFPGDWVQKLLSLGYPSSPIKLALAIIFNLATAATLFLFAVLFLARYAFLWFLVIVSPFAFFAYILPGTRKLWNQWWNTFIQWTFIGVAGGFTLYLSGQIFNNLKAGQIIVPPDNFLVGLLPNIDQIIAFAIPTVFSVIGLWVTLSSSAPGADFVISKTKWAAGLAGRKVAQPIFFSSKVRNAVGKIKGTRVGQKIGQIDEWLKPKKGEGMAKTGIKWALRGLTTLPARSVAYQLRTYTMQNKKQWEEDVEKIIRETHGDLDTMLQKANLPSLQPEKLAYAIAKTHGAKGLEKLKDKHPKFYEDAFKNLAGPILRDKMADVAKFAPIKDLIKDPEIKNYLKEAFLDQDGKKEVEKIKQEIIAGKEKEIGKEIVKEPSIQKKINDLVRSIRSKASSEEINKKREELAGEFKTRINEELNKDMNKIEEAAVDTYLQRKIANEIKAEDIPKLGTALDDEILKRTLPEVKSWNFLRKIENQKPGWLREMQESLAKAAETPEEFEEILKKYAQKNPQILTAPYGPTGQLLMEQWEPLIEKIAEENKKWQTDKAKSLIEELKNNLKDRQSVNIFIQRARKEGAEQKATRPDSSISATEEITKEAEEEVSKRFPPLSK